jgi:hypothetical protein
VSESTTPAAAGILVLGMHRSGTSAVTRLIGLLGARTPPDDDLVQPTDKNPKGYWESESLVNLSERVLRAVGCDMRCPIVLEPGWEDDSRLDVLRHDAPDAIRRVFPATPWVWKDPRHCLTLSFWRSVLDVPPVIVLVNRNPLEIAASVGRLRSELDKTYALALWERYLRHALVQSAGLHVLVTGYEEVLADPVAWCGRTHEFLESAGVPADPPRDGDVESFVDHELQHVRYARSDVLRDDDLSGAQRELFVALETLAGPHPRFVPPELPAETPTTERLLDEQRRAIRERHERLARDHERGSSLRRRLRGSRLAGYARPLPALARRIKRSFSGRSTTEQ